MPEDPNHLIGECPKPPRDKNQRAFVGGSRSDSGEEDNEKIQDETCLVAQAPNEICLRVNLEPDEWIKDSGCSKHMTGNRKLFSTYKAYNGGNVIFGSNLRGNIIGKGCTIVSIRTDHGREFDNEVQFGEFCNANGITHNFSAPCTPQSNGVVERKNRTLQEMSRTMLNEQSLPQKFWCNAVDTSTYILNRILIRTILGKTPYEILRGRKPTLDYFRVFGSKCFILNTKDYLTKFDLKSYEGVFLDRPDIMFSVCLCARFQEAPKTSHLEVVKRIFRYIKGTMHLGLWYPKGTSIETVVYADSNHAGDYVNRKSTSGICTFVGCCLTSWFSKKQTALAISTTEAEYVSAGKACQQALWMKQALIDYDIRLNDVPIMCDNKGVIGLSKNSVQHSRTKHIEIRHHFLRDNVQKGHISIEKVPSTNIADILTKPLKRELFNYLRLGLGMMEHIPSV
ncbi:retrovirus-related pol polyprotein from transposon TNT 1-94 [Tanacetum coccineum]